MEHQMKFTAELVPVLQAKRKWHTRRLVEIQPPPGFTETIIDEQKAIHWFNPQTGQHYPTPGVTKPWSIDDRLRVNGNGITLVVDLVWAERLMDISAEEASLELGDDPEMAKFTCRQRFFDLWDRIYGEGAHQLNPWVWVIKFKYAPPLPPASTAL
jgi:hypothetical protein